MKKTITESKRTRAGSVLTNNPLPLALIGIGAGILVYNASSGKSSARRTDFNTGESDSNNPQASDAKGIISNATEKISGTATSAYESVAGAANSAYSSAADVAGRAYGKAGDLANVAQDGYSRYLEEKPLALAAAAVAVGAAVGFAIPSTSYEGKLMGETREGLLSKAGETANDLIDKAKDAATKAGQTVTEELSAAVDQKPTA